MFEGWDSFYLLIGGAAGALIGLLFVVATLTGNVGREKAMHGAAIYMTPTVFHFAVVLVTSALTAVPQLPQRAAAVAGGALGVLRLGYAINISWMLPPHRGAPPTPPWTHLRRSRRAPSALYVAVVSA